tara:strand:- start:19 stop:300 length:282 start_codon:yes stop_codon:yes gene_type:complete
LIISTKKSWVDIRKIKGKISKRVDGTFKRVIKNGRYISDLASLKKVISSNNVKINVKEKKIKVSKIIFLKNNLTKYLSKVFIIILLWKLKSYK